MMLFKSLLAWSRFMLPALVVLALLVAVAPWHSEVRPALDAGDLLADPKAYVGNEVVITGKWMVSGPSKDGYMVIELRGKKGDRVVCHFEDVPAADRSTFEKRQTRPGERAVHGRCALENGHAILHGCSLRD